MMKIDGEERNGTEVTPYGLQQICGVAFGELLVSIPVLRRSAVAFFYSRNFSEDHAGGDLNLRQIIQRPKGTRK